LQVQVQNATSSRPYDMPPKKQSLFALILKKSAQEMIKILSIIGFDLKAPNHK
jgi:hypothetical protein